MVVSERCAFCRLVGRFFPGTQNRVDADRAWDTIWLKSYDWDESQADSDDFLVSKEHRSRADQAVDLWHSDPEASFGIVLDLAQRGSKWALLQIGMCYEIGHGTAKDLQQSQEWYRRACVAGSQRAMLRRAKIFASQGDFAGSASALSDGVKNNWIPAVFWTAWYRHKHSKSAETYKAVRPLLRDAARSGHPAAQLVFGRFLVVGKYGIFNRIIGIRMLIKVCNQYCDDSKILNSSE
jgi:hypothetical protein